MHGLSRRDILKASAALPAYAFAAPPETITPALVKAAKKEG